MGRGVRGGGTREEEGGKAGGSVPPLSGQETRKAANKVESTPNPPSTRYILHSLPLCLSFSTSSLASIMLHITHSPCFSVAVVVAVPARIDVLAPAAHSSLLLLLLRGSCRLCAVCKGGCESAV